MGSTNSGLADKQKGGAAGGTNEAKSTRSKTTANSGGTGGGNRGTGGKGTTTTTKEPGQASVGISDVTDKPKTVSINVETKEPEEKKPGRGRPKGSSTKNKPAAKTNKKAEIDSTHFVLLLQTTTGILATRKGFEMFALSKVEAEQIGKPLAAILSKNEAVGDFAGEYADHIALLIACATIFIPKFLIYQATKKEGEKNNERTTTTTIPTVSEQNRNTNNVQDNVQPLSGSINDFLNPIV